MGIRPISFYRKSCQKTRCKLFPLSLRKGVSSAVIVETILKLFYFKVRCGVSPFITLSLNLTHSIPRQYSAEYPRLSRGRPEFDSPPGRFFWFSDKDECLKCFFFLTLNVYLKGAFASLYSRIRIRKCLIFFTLIQSKPNACFPIALAQAQTSIAKYS